MSRYKVPAAERAEVARALIAAADNPDLEVRTSGDGEFIVSEALWDKAMSGEPAADVPQPAPADDQPEDDAEPEGDEPEVAEDDPEPAQDEPAPPPPARRARHGKK